MFKYFKKHKVTLFFVVLVIVFLTSLVFVEKAKESSLQPDGKSKIWEVQSIDSVKYSRDVAREKQDDASYDKVIEDHVAAIASTGATHIAIGTPYSEEFIPFMKRWVNMARKYNLNIWFRGNLPGWEEWFGYKRVTRAEHTDLTVEFILANGSLFKDGDIFSACPECENGGAGDPRLNGDVVGHRKFLIDEYRAVRDAFRKIDKNVSSNFNPMNGDVARLVMDKDTTRELGGYVVVDHYVRTPEETAEDIKEFAKISGGKVILGEFGAPIPDIHGDMTQEEQAEWLDNTLSLLADMPEVAGVNYWTSHGGSTQLWNYDNSPREGVRVLSKYFNPSYVSSKVIDETGQPIKNVQVRTENKIVQTDKNGKFLLPILKDTNISLVADGYKKTSLYSGDTQSITMLDRIKENNLYKIRKFLYKMQIIFTFK